MAFRTLQPGDEEALDRFLRAHAETSMFLRSNLRRAGLAYKGCRYQGTYFVLEEGGRILASAALFWNGNLTVQAPEGLDGLIEGLKEQLDRPVEWLSGPWDQVMRAREVLGMLEEPTSFEAREGLFTLDLAELRVPALLSSGTALARPPVAGDLDLLAGWRAAYNAELFQIPVTRASRERARVEMESLRAEGVIWVLETEGRLVSSANFNASLPDAVQLGGVWTPPEHRCRSYARCAVAGALLDARGRGVEKGILFTDSNPAEKAYRALGFERIGEYGLVGFE